MRGRGDLARAAAELDGAEVELDASEPLVALLVRRALGELRVAQGRMQEGIAHLRACGRALEEWGLRNPAIVSWRSLLALPLPPEDREEALTLAHAEVELARAFEVPDELGVALRAAGLIKDGLERWPSWRARPRGSSTPAR